MNVHGRGRTAGTSLDAAALSLARGASGVWLRAGSRFGLACRGTVYLLVGYLAFRLALAVHGRTGAPASSAGAVQAAVSPAWGRIPLVLLVAGLAAYALTQLLEAVFRPSRAKSAAGRWRQRAVSSWGCLLYTAFCLSTARLLLATPPRGTAQSEQRQDIDVTATVLRTGWGQLLPDPGRAPHHGSCRGNGPPVGRARLPGAVHRRAHVPDRWPSSPGRSARTAASRAPSCSALVGFFIIKAAVLSSARQVKGTGRGFRSVASSACGAWAGLARLRPVLLRPLLPDRGPLPRPDTGGGDARRRRSRRPRARSGWPAASCQARRRHLPCSGPCVRRARAGSHRGSCATRHPARRRPRP